MALGTQTEFNDAMFKALGRFVVEFSRLLHALELSTLQIVTGMESRAILAATALAGRPAASIINVFFSVLMKIREGSLTKNSEEILCCLRGEILKVNDNRNRIMHDAWLVTRNHVKETPKPFERMSVSAKTWGISLSVTSVIPEEINKNICDISRLTKIITAIMPYRPTKFSLHVEADIDSTFHIVGRSVQFRVHDDIGSNMDE